MSSPAPDIGKFVGKRSVLSDGEIFHIITSHWEPSSSFQFPHQKGQNRGRRCQRQWLEKFPWLAYSAADDGLLCKHCMFFSAREDIGQFVSKPFHQWQKALEKIQEHGRLKYHEDAMIQSENFLARMKKPEAGIDVILDGAAAEQIENNRKVLGGIIEIILLCGRQGLALRGTDDDGVMVSNNRSNFNALLKFRIASGDQILKQHFETCSPNATYISKTTQNNLIEIIGSEIMSCILDEVKEARFYSILADEVTDKANWEQLSIILRFVDKTASIREEFLTFVACEDITGETLANNIMQKLQDWGLDINDLRGQGYDGASNMSGKFRGVQARLKEVNLRALCKSLPQSVHSQSMQHTSSQKYV